MAAYLKFYLLQYLKENKEHELFIEVRLKGYCGLHLSFSISSLHKTHSNLGLQTQKEKVRTELSRLISFCLTFKTSSGNV